MGWSIGYDDRWKRWIGYGVPAYCDYPDCDEEINRGLAYVCANEEPYGGEFGCGLFMCERHKVWQTFPDGEDGLFCKRCAKGEKPYEPKPEHPDWIRHVLTDPSWKEWRDENPLLVAEKYKLPEGNVL